MFTKMFKMVIENLTMDHEEIPEELRKQIADEVFIPKLIAVYLTFNFS